jgi:probable HAF family extracellular repeat protein
MKSRTLTAWTTATTLFAAVIVPVRLTAQEQQQPKQEHHRYRFVDIGTFGGPESYVNAAFASGSPNQINNRGTVVGGAATRIHTPPHKQICGGPDGEVPFVFHAFEWLGGVLTDLGALPGVECSQAVSINEGGEIVGVSGNGVIDPLAGIEGIRAVLWKDGEIKDLGTLGGRHSVAIGINNRGQVAGFSVNAIPDPFSLLYGGIPGGTQTRAFLWHKGHMRDLHTLGGPDAQAFGVNERGQVIGISYINSTPNPTTGLPTADPFLWTEGRGMIDLGTLGGTFGSAGSLNNLGQVIGVSNLAGDQTSHPFFWDDGKLIDLFADTIGGNPITADAINDAGEVVGNAAFPNGASGGEAYLWKVGVITNLGTLPGDCYSEAFAINSRGQAVGQSFSCDTGIGRSVLWENGSMVDLNKLIPHNSDLQLDNAFAINDRGEISGFGLPSRCRLDTRCGHAFLLIPCGDNHSDGEECRGNEDEGTLGAIQNSPVPVNEEPAAVSVDLIPAEIGARMRAQLGRNRRLGVRLSK